MKNKAIKLINDQNVEALRALESEITHANHELSEDEKEAANFIGYYFRQRKMIIDKINDDSEAFDGSETLMFDNEEFDVIAEVKVTHSFSPAVNDTPSFHDIDVDIVKLQITYNGN